VRLDEFDLSRPIGIACRVEQGVYQQGRVRGIAQAPRGAASTALRSSSSTHISAAQAIASSQVVPPIAAVPNSQLPDGVYRIKTITASSATMPSHR
jgi:hypothetical protein